MPPREPVSYTHLDVYKRQAYCTEALGWGTTTLVTDPHEIANVAGGAGVRFMLDTSAKLPVNYYVQLPSCCLLYTSRCV